VRSRKPKTPSDPASPAGVRSAALRLLAVRSRGTEDLARTLERRGYDRTAVREALGRLVAEGWLDDLAAARSIVESRVGRYGKARIGRELSALGFSKEISAAALVDAAGAPEEKALSAAFQKLWRRSEGLDPSVRRRRVAGALSRKGFAAEAISAMMQGSHEEDEMDLG
jgi:regulatory protein